jgi:type IV pilus assembly protein PilQ
MFNLIILVTRYLQFIAKCCTYYQEWSSFWRYASLVWIICMALSSQVWAQASTLSIHTAEVLVPRSTSSTQATLENINFLRNDTGHGVLALTFNTTAPLSNIIQTGMDTTLSFTEYNLNPEQLAVLDVSQFATSIKSIESFVDENKVSLVVRASQLHAIKQVQDSHRLFLTFAPVEQKSGLNQQAAGYEGKPISLDFKDIPVRQILQIIAQINNFNLVTTDSVIGNVTINLKDVPWDQALDMILQIRGLDKRIEGNILLIAPQSELAAQDTALLQTQQQVQQLTPLLSKNLKVNYAKAQDMANILKSAQGGILSPRGSVAVDSRTNTLLLRDTQSSIDEAQSLLYELDIPVKQVLIESRMVTVRDNVDEQLGVRWGFSGSNSHGNTFSGSATGASKIASGGFINTELSDRLNISLPVTNAAGRVGVQIGSLINGAILDLELSALESENKGEIIASPRITVANQQEAYIEQGTEIPYVQATSSGATSVEFKKAVLSLKVTPHITPDNRIILDLIVTQDTRGETVSTSTGPAVAIDTQEIKTQVLVENVETIVLGGIFQHISTNDSTKVPILGDIPLMGNLFRTKVSIEQKRELLIFVTPKIIME